MREWVVALPGDPPVHQLVRPIRTHLWRRAPGQAVRVGPLVPEQVRSIQTQLVLVLDRLHLPAPRTIRVRFHNQLSDRRVDPRLLPQELRKLRPRGQIKQAAAANSK